MYLSALLSVALGVILLSSGSLHLTSPSSLKIHLNAHEILPSYLRPTAARVLGPLELLLGVASISIAAVPSDTLRATWPISAFDATAGVLLFAYVAALRQKRYAGSCGCTALDLPVTRATYSPSVCLTVLGTASAVNLGYQRSHGGGAVLGERLMGAAQGGLLGMLVLTSSLMSAHLKESE